MTISDVLRRVSHTGTDNASSTYAWTFSVKAASDIKVYIDDTVQSSGFTTTVNEDGTGNIVFASAPTSSQKVTITASEMSLARTTDYSTAGTFTAASINTALDDNIRMTQQLKEAASRALTAPKSELATNSLELPTVANRKGKTLAFNATTGIPEAGPTIADTTSVASATTNIGTVAGISSAVSTVSGLSSNISTLAGLSSEISTLAAKATELGRLGTADAVSDMNTLGTSDVVSDMNTLATSDIVSDLNTLATSDIVSDLNTLATSDVVSDMNTLASSSNVTNMNTLAGISSNITTVAGISANVTSVANNEANINRYASEYTISSSAPGSPSEGDLWYDSTNNILKYYTGSAFVGITSDTDKLVSVSANDTTPGVLNGKLTAGANISLTEGSDGGNETLAVALNSAKLTAIDGLAVTDGNFVVGNGSTFVAENGATARTSLGIGEMGSKNLLINGDMSVWQRSTSVSGKTSGGYFTADRWGVGIASHGTYSIARSTTVPTAGFGYSWKLDCTTADTSLAAGAEVTFYQAIEGQNLQRIKKGTSSADSLTLSFWIRSNLTGTFTAELLDADNGRQISKTFTISSADTFEKKELTFAGDTSGALTNDANASLYVVIYLAAGSNFTSGTLNTSWASTTSANRVSASNVNIASSTSNEVLITGMQLEVGSTATDFEFEPYDVTLQKCKRYYHKMQAESPYDRFVMGFCVTTDDSRHPVNFHPQMRGIPTLETGGTFAVLTAAEVGQSISSIAIDTNTDSSQRATLQVAAAATTLVAGNGTALAALNDASTYIAFTAEL
tara:strand:- start:139 stop:2523 length:2385 start_codon:yes stop_codon:yes gene_type:complete